MKLSVCMLAYKHAPYIEKAIDSILRQQVNFDYEIVIGDDFSQDGTAAILERYKQQHPGRFVVMERNQNVGAVQNLIETLGACRGEYVAFLEGDDYWTHTGKLQTQVDFLDQHRDYVLCFHHFSILAGNKRKRAAVPDVQADTDIHDLLRHTNYIKTLTVVYRNDPRVLDFYKSFDNPPLGDYLIFVGAAQYGKIRRLPYTWGVYRVHAQGNWSQHSLSSIMPRCVKVVTALFDRLPALYHDDLRIQLLWLLEQEAMLKPNTPAIDNPEFAASFTKLGITSYMLEYIRHMSQIRQKPSFYSKHIPMGKLMGAVIHKFKNKLPG